MAIYRKFPGVDGAVYWGKNPNYHELKSFEWGADRHVPAPKSGVARKPHTPDVNEVTVTKDGDKASPLLFQAAVSGDANKAPTVTIDFTTGATGETSYMKYELENCLISSYSVRSNGGETSTEELSLNFTKITYSADTNSASFDLKQMEAK